MPILHIDIIGSPADQPADLAQQLADAAASALDSRPQGTWVKLQYIPVEHYAENEGAETGVRPIIVSVIQADVPDGEDRQVQVSRLTEAIADAAGHPPENVHILLEPAARGRIAFGGNLVD